MARKHDDRFALSRNFLATDETPETLFGIPVVADRSQYTPEDLAFFRKHPEAGGYYDMGDGEEAPGEPPMQAASKGGHLDVKGIRWRDYKYGDGGVRIDPNNIKGTGIAFDEAKDRMRVPKGREAEFAAYMDNLAKLYNPLVWDEKLDQPARQSPSSAIYYLYGPNAYLGKDPSRPASNLVPPDWRVDNRYARDYDFVAAFLAGAQPGINPEDGAWHMPDSGGKMPTHPGFSKESPYAKDPRWAPLAGDWTEDGEYVPGEAELKANPDLFHEDAKGGRTVHAATDAGRPKKKIPPIVRGPVHYGPPPPPARGKYPGVANNPGNVEKHERRSDKTLFKGEIGGGVRPRRFAIFSDPVDGLTAAAVVIARRAAELGKSGRPFTIGNYAPRYNPPTENDTEGYIRNLSRYTGFARDQELDVGDVDDMAKLLRNVVRFESGVPHSEWFTDDEYRRAARAMNRSPESAPSLPASTNRQASGGSTQTYKVGNP